MVDDRIDERALSKLRWRCRRGLLENDLLIERFFDRHASTWDDAPLRDAGIDGRPATEFINTSVTAAD